MEQPSEKQLEDADDQKGEQLIEEYIQNILDCGLERQEDEDRLDKDIAKEHVEEVKNSPKIENDQDSMEDPEHEELRRGECQQESILAEHLVIEKLDENVLKNKDPKEKQELEEEIPELNSKLKDQLLEKESESEFKGQLQDELDGNTQTEERLPINLKDQAVLVRDESLENEEQHPQISENTEQLTDNLENLEKQDNHKEQAAGECTEDNLQDPSVDTQNKENKDRIEEEEQENGEEHGGEASKPEEDLPNEQVTQFLRQLVNQLWPDLEANPELRLNRASAKGDNYLGVVWRLQVASDLKRSLVVKLPPQNRVRRKQFFARPCFLRETAAYQVFLPLAAMIQEKWKIPAEDRFRQHALCFGTRQDEANECIVLEDLSCSGFHLHNRFLDLSIEHVRQVICTYAKLHAISLAGKRQFPERMYELQKLVDIFEQRREDHALGVYFENLKGSALSSLLSPGDDPYRVRLEEYFARGSYFELLLPLVSGSNCEPFAVICHGDCWNNNILYKTTGGGDLEDVRLIDWQLMRYASPVTDLAYFLFTCTSQEFRQQYLNNMLEDYYEELGLQLNRLGEQLEELLPRPAFDDQVATKAAVGLLLAMMVLPIVTMQGQDVPDLQAISDRIEAGATTDLQGAGFLGVGNEATFKRRMREVILDCVDFNYI
ncbi:uncharacterized protein LOC119557469 [Drosophila subpulchrella]|uniref:uncharacterized protein LOC119557469 n=1 Tax=Drosophila subpulchrella TaxID=1486046 RepID=UPI0018A1A8E9|nr:uncharacterized protein LOC119557469 [Drosophila subpulchrella]